MHCGKLVKIVARKKIVFVIVEGPSDDEALGLILNRYYDKNAVHVEIMHGDLTSDYSVNANNIASKIGNIVRTFAKSNHYKCSDFQEVIHLVDMDGAYIEKENILYSESHTKPYYTQENILIDRPQKIVERNERKRKNLDRICTMDKVWSKIPYHAYYMSCNLDHVLYNKLNSSDREKEEDAYQFACRYKNQIPEFIKFISKSDFSVAGDFKKSWEFIKEEKHSLERYTNIGICFKNTL